MQRLLLSFLFLFAVSAASAQKLKPADEGSKVHFVIKNFGINTGGDFSGLTGEINFVSANVPASTFDVSVSVNTIDTDNEMRDKDLKKSSYFDAEKYPLITIKSTKINRTNKSSSGWYQFNGTLTMHGLTKPITFLFQQTKKSDGYLFVGGFIINRMDYGVGKSSSVLSNNVNISLSVLAKKG